MTSPTPTTAPATRLVYLDTETTGLSPRLHDVIEVAWAVEDGPVKSLIFPHTLNHASPEALEVNRYYERGLDAYATTGRRRVGATVSDLIIDLTGATIVAEHYGFDAAMLHRKLGFEPWHYRKVELSTAAMMVFNLDRPEGLAKTAHRLRCYGAEIPEATHAASADVECLRACYLALRSMRTNMELP